jgi:hypothetical protein
MIKQNSTVVLIGISFVLMHIQVLLPIYSTNINVLALLFINVIILSVINIIQRRPSIKAFDEGHDDYYVMRNVVLESFDGQAYFISIILTTVLLIGVLIGIFAFSLDRTSTYDVTLLLIANVAWIYYGYPEDY